MTQLNFANTIAVHRLGVYNSRYIRPLAVSPLNHSESVPIPRGFFISGITGLLWDASRELRK